MTNEPDDMAELRREIEAAGRSAARWFEPGALAMVIAFAVLVILVAVLLPWVGPVSGLQVLLGDVPNEVKVGVVPRVFACAAVVAGVLGSALGLTLRRWAIAWLCALGCFIGSVTGVLSIWSTQTTTSHQPGPGPGVGLVIAVAAVVVLLVTWVRIAASRPGLR
ncbi:MAG TPA: hypothetical protein VGP03_12675 [Pseudonocardiaceae bacterium]|nr:hypothetical protein [Pseudonocardiaceae bacterium]